MTHKKIKGGNEKTIENTPIEMVFPHLLYWSHIMTLLKNGDYEDILRMSLMFLKKHFFFQKSVTKGRGVLTPGLFFT